MKKISVVAPDAKPIELANIDQYAGKIAKTEGPIADAESNVYFTDPFSTNLFKWSHDGVFSIFTNKFNGPNGLAIDRDGNLIAVEAYNRRVAMLDKKGQITVLTDSYNGGKYNEPNDLFLDRKGGIYFSDPYFHVHSEALEQKCHGVYYLSPDRTKVLLVINDMINPNGMCLNPDESQLYVIDTGDETTYAYAVNVDGTLANKRVFVKWGYDGLTVDIEGNVYLTGKENYMNIYDAQGNYLEKIEFPITTGHTANACFGGKDGQTLFITAGNSLFSLKMRVKG